MREPQIRPTAIGRQIERQPSARAVVPRMHAGRGMRAAGRGGGDFNFADQGFDLFDGNHSRAKQQWPGTGKGQYGGFDAYLGGAAVQNEIDAIAERLADMVGGGGGELRKAVSAWRGDGDTGFHQQSQGVSIRGHAQSDAG